MKEWLGYRLRLLFRGLVIFAFVGSLLGQTKVGEAKIKVFSEAFEKRFPHGYEVIDFSGKVLKSQPESRAAKVEASAIVDGVELYISDWSYRRYSEKDIAPNWIRPLPGPEPSNESTQPLAPKKRIQNWDGEPLLESPVTALLVGNTNYIAAGGNGPDLKNPTNDVDLLAKTLGRRWIKPQVVKDANRAALLCAVTDAVADLGPEGILFFYFAGHGLQLGGENFLVPVGADLSDEASVKESCVPLAKLLESLEEADPRLAIVVLDCCRNNPFNATQQKIVLGPGLKGVSRGSTILPPAGRQSGLAFVNAPPNTLVAFATSPGAVAADWIERSDKNSPYADALAAALDGGLEIREVFEKAGSSVRGRTGAIQNPWKSNDSFRPFYLTFPRSKLVSPSKHLRRSTGYFQRNELGATSKSLAELASCLRNQTRSSPSALALTFLLTHSSLAIPVGSTVSNQENDPFYGRESTLKVTANHVTAGETFRMGRNGEDLEKGLFPFVFTENEVYGRKRNDDFLAIRAGDAANGERNWVLGRPPSEVLSGIEGFDHLEQLRSSWLIEGSRFTMTPVPLRGVIDQVVLIPSQKRLILSESFWPWGFKHCTSIKEYVITPTVGFDRSTINSLEPVSVYSQDAQSQELDLGTANGKVTLHGEFLIHRVDHEHTVRINTPAGKDDYSRLLGYSNTYKTIALSSGNTQVENMDENLWVVDLVTREVRRPRRFLQGRYATPSTDGEWLFSYDALARPLLLDFRTGGNAVAINGSPVPEVIGALDWSERIAFDQVEKTGVKAPLLHSMVPGLYEAPPWLADLATAIVGFSHTPTGDIEWVDDPAALLRDLIPRIKAGEGCNEAYLEWSKWFLKVRLAGIAPE